MLQALELKETQWQKYHYWILMEMQLHTSLMMGKHLYTFGPGRPLLTSYKKKSMDGMDSI